MGVSCVGENDKVFQCRAGFFGGNKTCHEGTALATPNRGAASSAPTAWSLCLIAGEII